MSLVDRITKDYVLIKSKTIKDLHYPITVEEVNLYEYSGSETFSPRWYIQREKSVFDARSFNEIDNSNELLNDGVFDSYEYDDLEKALERFSSFDF